MNIWHKMVYDYLDEDSLIPTPHQFRLEDSTIMQPYGIAKVVLIEFQDSLTLDDTMVMDMDPRQQTSIIQGKPFQKSVKVTIDKKRGIINIKVDGVHDNFIYHPKKGKMHGGLVEHMISHPQSRNRRPQNAMKSDKMPSAAENFLPKFS
jgi:hypothetical protein